MSDYLYLYRGGNRTGSPEDMQQVMQRWIAWIQDLQAKQENLTKLQFDLRYSSPT